MTANISKLMEQAFSSTGIPSIRRSDFLEPSAHTVASFATRMANTVQMVAGNSYINGLEISDQLLRYFLDISVELSYSTRPSLLVPYAWLLKESSHLAEGSTGLMKIQYNLPEKLFISMLEEDNVLLPKYSMALWDKGAGDLHQAQVDMLEDVIVKACIQDGDDILDLGCGWGSAANYILAKFPNARVSGLNLSHGQCEYIRSKMKEPDCHLNTPRFSLYEQDFNDAIFEHKFDKIIALGSFEHIGNLTNSFQKLACHLKENGKVFIHVISTTFPFSITHSFIDTYIFPNMRVWSVDAIPKVNADLRTTQRWYINGLNYSKTLQEWLKNFDGSQPLIKDLDYGMDYAKFRRMWRYYIQLCIAYFEGCGGEVLGNSQFLLTHS